MSRPCIYCTKETIEPELCDFCTFYNFNPGSRGEYLGNGYCNKHNEPRDPDDACSDFECSSGERYGFVDEAKERLSRINGDNYERQLANLFQQTIDYLDENAKNNHRGIELCKTIRAFLVTNNISHV